MAGPVRGTALLLAVGFGAALMRDAPGGHPPLPPGVVDVQHLRHLASGVAPNGLELLVDHPLSGPAG
jgi:hypothetical protein